MRKAVSMKKKQVTVGSLQKETKDLRARIAAIESDREKLRGFIKRELQSQLYCMVKNEQCTPRAIAERIITTLNGCDKFYLWGY